MITEVNLRLNAWRSAVDLSAGRLPVDVVMSVADTVLPS